MTNPIFQVKHYGAACLRKKSTPVKEVGSSERLLIKSMVETMYEEQGIGLAAPQIGVNKRIIVIDVGDGPVAVINPRVTRKSGSSVLEEGCLSVPQITIKIARPQKITLKFLDINGRLHERQFEDLMARAILHEIDHLNGKLIVDYASFYMKRKLKKQLKEIEECERKVEEVSDDQNSSQKV